MGIYCMSKHGIGLYTLFFFYLQAHLCEDSPSHCSSCEGRGIAEWEILKQGQSFAECVSKLFQLPSAQQWLTPLPVCLLRGLQGGISPNYLYWSRETGEYQAGLSSLHSPYLSSTRFITPSPSLPARRENIIKETGSFYVRRTLPPPHITVSTIAVIYCSHSGCCD